MYRVPLAIGENVFSTMYVISGSAFLLAWAINSWYCFQRICYFYALFLMRVAVYFRDGYRATSFGVPDLVEIFRRIDKKLAPEGKDLENRVKLSFIGHSMGAYVVTSVVRILSDVFDQGSGSPDPTATAERPSPNIGHALELARLVLVSPDIPAEAFIANRANFLQNWTLLKTRLLAAFLIPSA
jgi:pimeloyl-ACP methyl ester carboxylesterase